MISTALQKLERAVIEWLGEMDLPSLAGDAKRLSDAFTKGRAGIPPDYIDDPKTRAAYVAHFVLTNAAKTIHCLREADGLGLLRKKDCIRILDLGCGPGTASLAASLFFAVHVPGARVEIVGVERSAAALSEAKALFEKIRTERHSLETIAGLVRADTIGNVAPGRRFDLVIAANLLNEFEGKGEALALCRALIENHISDGGIILIIDPALRETTRPLMKLRDDIIGAGAAVCAPCLHEKSCPMYAANERDWCHFYIEWERPTLIQRMDDLTGLDHRHLKMAYLIFTKGVSSHESRVTSHGMWRVVSSPLVSKGKRELVLCGSNGALLRAMRQDKNASEENRAFGESKRGDVVSSPAETKISKETPVGIVRRWGS